MVSLRLFLAAFVFIVDAARPEHGAAGALGLENTQPDPFWKNWGKNVGNGWNSVVSSARQAATTAGQKASEFGKAATNAATTAGGHIGRGAVQLRDKVGQTATSGFSKGADHIGKASDWLKLQAGKVMSKPGELSKETQTLKAMREQPTGQAPAAVAADEANAVHQLAEDVGIEKAGLKAVRGELAAEQGKVVRAVAESNGVPSDSSRRDAQEAVALGAEVKAKAAEIAEAEEALSDAAQDVVAIAAASPPQGGEFPVAGMAEEAGGIAPDDVAMPASGQASSTGNFP